MNVVFISHCDFQGNSAMHIFSVANVLTDLGLKCVVCVPNDPTTVTSHGKPSFAVISYADAFARGVGFPGGKGPDIVHAWTPREMVRRLTKELVSSYNCPYLVHLEDNEDVILETELGDRSYEELCRLPTVVMDARVPEHRSHPVRSRQFIAGAAGVTALTDRLFEFKPPASPGLIFWPGFDPDFARPSVPSCELRRRYGVHDGCVLLVYNGNIHDTNEEEVRSLFLSVQALRRSGRDVTILKTGWNHVGEKNWIRESIESGAVTDLGFLPRTEIAPLVAAADILVQPGRPGRFNDYRFPSKLPEFFASGKPVILPRTNVGHAVRDGTDALLLEYGNAIEIAQKIDRLIDDPALAARIGASGRNFAIRRLTWSETVPPLKDFYTGILARMNGERFAHPAIDFTSPVKMIAFYLPQFHPTKENDEFWGKGFTEWTNVTRAKPNFEGHCQPQLPADLGFYDLRVPDVLEEQVELARRYGIYGFCYYYYWFEGRRLLERPLDTMLAAGRPDFPFCICWANENWTRNWDGANEEILIRQDCSGDSCERFIRDVIPIMQDRRYIRVNGAPMLLVYRVNLLPDPRNVAKRWRQICAEAGVGAVHLCAVQSFGIGDPREYGFDAAVEFPPHTKRALLDVHSFPGLHTDFEGYLEDYPAIVGNQLAVQPPDYTLYRGAMPAWDNTPRRGVKAHILVDATPELYERWLYELVKLSLDCHSQEPFIFINAWNEWAEGAYLEPSQHLGHARLAASLSALRRGTADHAAGLRIPENAPPATGPDGLDLDGVMRRYERYPLRDLSYATVRDYCDSFDNLLPLATANGDLKDCQRPWVLKAILSRVRQKGRLLEIGAGEPIIADLLQRAGHEVWIADPYDGSGNGPTAFDEYKKRYPNLKFVQSVFDDGFPGIDEHSVDCIYSISVLEHVPSPALKGVFAGMRRFLRPHGVTVHAIDHVHRGNGANEHLANLRLMIRGFGFEEHELDDVLAEMSEDADTYYLSAESHNRWRAGVPYDQFPMRVCVSVQIVTEATRLRIAT
jgi:glycosyltransferase involved in cell wall biosynthesis